MVFHLEDNNTTNEIDQAILKVLLSGNKSTTSMLMDWLLDDKISSSELFDWVSQSE